MALEQFITQAEIEKLILAMDEVTEEDAVKLVKWAAGVRVDQALLELVLKGLLTVIIPPGVTDGKEFAFKLANGVTLTPEALAKLADKPSAKIAGANDIGIPATVEAVEKMFKNGKAGKQPS